VERTRLPGAYGEENDTASLQLPESSVTPSAMIDVATCGLPNPARGRIRAESAY